MALDAMGDPVWLECRSYDDFVHVGIIQVGVTKKKGEEAGSQPVV